MEKNETDLITATQDNKQSKQKVSLTLIAFKLNPMDNSKIKRLILWGGAFFTKPVFVAQ